MIKLHPKEIWDSSKIFLKLLDDDYEVQHQFGPAPIYGMQWDYRVCRNNWATQFQQKA